MLDGRDRIPLAYKGQSRFHTSSVCNIAELARICLEQPETHVLNIGDPDPPNVARIGRSIARCMGYRGRLVGLLSPDYPPSLGFTPWSCPRPFLVDMAAAADIGYRPAITYEEAAFETCDWLMDQAGKAPWPELFPVLAQYPRDLFDYTAEDRLLEMCPDGWVSLDGPR
jgi:nucleoside-diphosphate-sugar epimerase